MKNGIILLGAGGHAKVCIELFQAMGEQVDFCIGDEHSHNTCLDVPVLKGDAHLHQLYENGYTKAFIAIGSNKVRHKLATMAKELNYQLVNAISPTAIISPSATLGQGIAIMAGAIINANTKISDLAIINTGATVDHDCKIGTAVHIAPQTALAGNVNVGDNSFLGIGTKVIPEILIGKNVIAGAGSVIINDINDNEKIAGVPAKPIK